MLGTATACLPIKTHDGLVALCAMPAFGTGNWAYLNSHVRSYRTWDSGRGGVMMALSRRLVSRCPTVSATNAKPNIEMTHPHA